jgi:hypothetical protein
VAGPADIAAKFDEALRADRVRLYTKVGEFDIRPAVSGEQVESVIDGEHETVNTAHPGDFVVHGVKGEQYIITADTLRARYGEPLTAPDPAGYRRYPVKGKLYAFRYNGEPIKFVAPWGEEMIANPGDYIGTHAIGSNQYWRVEKTIFAATYVAAA